MQSNIDKSFPYPVLGNSNDFESNLSFVLRARYGLKNRSYEFLTSVSFDNFRDDFDKLISDGKVQISILVFNPQTFFRKFYTDFQKEMMIAIPMEEIRGKTFLTAHLTTLEDLTSFDPEGKNKSFYGESTFDVDASGILAVSNTLSLFLEPKFKKQNKENAKHIIAFRPSKTVKTTFEVSNWDSDQLTVEIPEKIYTNWQNHANNKDFLHIQKCSIYLPVLMEAILRIEQDDDEGYENKKWYHVIENLLRSSEIHESDDISKKAQVIMNGPIKNYVKELDKIHNILTGEDE
ncbi:hypothetical protein N9N24_04655 [Candidatus Marinimicrobia bacterium]|nr:hypothetical protein [Candidatus Neomarinimicrobiota bacterium]